MRRWLEEFEQFAIEVILEQRGGKRAAVLRAVLYLLSHVYGGAVQFRLWLYRKRIKRERQLGCLVIAIGNLTVGGTGKTPVVEKFARALQAGGRRVAILSRGYKSKKLPLLKRWIHALTNRAPYQPRIVSDGTSILLDSRMAGDEPYMLAVNLKDVIVLVDKNRVASGLYAIDKMGCDTLLLDDGMQFIHLKHRLDIVLIDCQAPFGNEYLLPRGTLREPPKNLRRASYIFITKSTPAGNKELIERIRTLQSHRRDHRVRASPAIPRARADRRTAAARLAAREIRRSAQRNRVAGKLRDGAARARREHRTHAAFRGPSSFYRQGSQRLHRALLEPRRRRRHHDGEGLRATAAARKV